MPWTKHAIEVRENVFGLSETSEIRTLSYREAILEATEALLSDERVFVLGEGVDDASGVFGTTLGLADRFGKERVMDTPIAENGITGIAMGASLMGMRPILIHMRSDFLLISLDQLLNHAAKWHYLTGGEVKVPLTIRCLIGKGWGSAAQHSQSLQALVAHLPGLKVLMPSTAYDAKGLLVSAVRDDNPVVIIEHRWLLDQKGYVPEGLYSVPIGKATVCCQGRDITIVGTSLMTHEAMRAAEQLREKGVEAEVIDLRSIKPWDEDCILASIRKTGRLLIADTGHRHGGVGAEISATAAEKGWNWLRAPIRRIHMPEAPVPAAHALELLYYPDHKDIVETALEICGKPCSLPERA